MKRQILTLLTILVLATGTALIAQGGGVAGGSTGSGSTGSAPLPPSQQVDQSNQPETGSGPDVDVDLGSNADNGVANVDVTRQTDSDTKAQDNGTAGNTGTTGTMGQGTRTMGQGTAGTTTGQTGTAGQYNQNSETTGNSYGNSTDTRTDNSADNGDLPSTASEFPLLGLLGALSLAGALALKANR